VFYSARYAGTGLALRRPSSRRARRPIANADGSFSRCGDSGDTFSRVPEPRGEIAAAAAAGNRTSGATKPTRGATRIFRPRRSGRQSARIERGILLRTDQTVRRVPAAGKPELFANRFVRSKPITETLPERQRMHHK